MLQINTLDKLHLGMQGENKATTIRIDMSAWAAEYPDAVFNVIFQPHDSTLVYPMVTSYDSETKVLSWTISNAVTAEAGECKTEIRAQDSETSLVKKSRIIPSFVAPSVTGSESEPPEPQEEWVTEVLNAAEDAVEAAEAAETAQGKAEDAQEAAETAQEKAEEAQEAAEDAQEAAEDAQEAAETAQGKAEDAQSAAETAQTAAEDAAENAEAYAIGKRNGTDVPSTDPTYHNNSKYWSDSAWEAAQHAASSTIDDTAGAGTTDKAWSANKIVTELDGKADLVSGLVPASQLPSYVDDVLEYASTSMFPAIGESSKIYVALDTNKSYRWSGSTYTELSKYEEATQSASGLMSAADKKKLDGIFDKIYPIGSIYMSVASTSPAILFGGTWDRLKSRFLLGAEDIGDTTDDPYIGGATGGAASVSYTPSGTVDGHTLTTDEIPSHSHGLNSHTHSYTYPTGSTGGNSGNTGAGEGSLNGNGYAMIGMTGQAKIYYSEKTGLSNWTSNYIVMTGGSGSSESVGNRNYAANLRGGSGSHSHSLNNHTHTVNTGSTNTGAASGNTESTGDGGSHNHGFTGTQTTINTMPPYIAVYMWKRTA